MNDASVTMETAHADGMQMVKITGEIDAHTAPAVLMTLDQLDATVPTALDLSDVSFIDSSGLRVLMLQSIRFEECGGRLDVSDASHAVDRLLDVAGVSERFYPPDDD